MPTTLPPTIESESAPPAVAVLARAPPDRDRVRRPMANRAGSPAPATRPKTRICQSALKLIQGEAVSVLP